MSDHPRLSDLTAAQLLTKAREYRDMAASATTIVVAASLLKLAEMYEQMARGRQ